MDTAPDSLDGAAAEYAKRAGLGKYSRDKSDNNAELS